MGRPIRPLFLVLLITLATACAVPGTDAADTEDCIDEFAKGVGMAPAVGDGFDEGELKRRIRHACEELVEAGLSDNSSEGELVAFLQKNPQIAGELCEASTEVLYANSFDAITAAFGGYVTKDDFMRLGRDGCVYAFTEGHGSLTTGPNFAALFRAHPNLIAPFCRAPLMQAYDQKPPPQPRRVYDKVVTNVCLDAIKTGVVDYSSGNFLSPSIDHQRFRQLLRAEWAKR
jgi:hypothetical protein